MENDILAGVIGFAIGGLNFVLFFLTLVLAKKHSNKAMNYIVGGYAVKFLITISLILAVFYLSGLRPIPLAISFLATTLLSLLIELTIILRKKS